jgi:hypothetical protein
MRSFLLPAAMILSMSGASLALASPTTTDGVIKSMDAKTHMITLADGTSYMLPKTFDASKIKVGEKVAVVWQLQGKINEASSVKAVKG